MRILPYVELPGELVEKESLLETRFEVVGGIPRKLFDLDRSLLICQKTILEKLRQNMGNVRSLLSLEVIDDYNQAHNDLVAIHSTPPQFDEGKLELASAYVRMHYPTEAHRADRRKLCNDIQIGREHV